LHAAFRNVLGEHVVQKGSLVNDERLRFDFAHYEAVTQTQMDAIEQMVNEQVRANSEVTTTLTDMDTAKSLGAMALFGEKYGDEVRVLSMGTDRFSVELCGGTHVQRTGDIGNFVLISEGGISAGVRRIEGLTGAAAEQYLRDAIAQTREAAMLLKCGRDAMLEKLGAQLEKNKSLEKELAQFKAKAASSAGADLAASAEEVGGIKVVAAKMDGLDRKGLMDAVDRLKNQLGQAVVLLSVVEEGKVSLIAGVSKEVSKQFPAGDLMREVAAAVGGKGGGRPDMAQGGGTEPEKLDAALKKVRVWVESKL